MKRRETNQSTVMRPPDTARITEAATPFAELTLQEILDDLATRFIINVPEEELATVERILFQIELAFWFYEDLVRDVNPQAPHFALKGFSARLFNHHPLLRQWANQHEEKYKEWIEYKVRVPVCGAILLNASLDKVLLVKGMGRSGSWTFPKGKINKGEANVDCAVREVREETGFDSSSLIREEDFVELTIREQRVRLYIVVGVAEDEPFAPLTRGEISKIEWHQLVNLPSTAPLVTCDQDSAAASSDHHRGGPARKDYYLVLPFVKHIRAWVVRKKAALLDRGRQPQRAFLTPPTAGDTAGSASDDEAPVRPAAFIVSMGGGVDESDSDAAVPSRLSQSPARIGGKRGSVQTRGSLDGRAKDVKGKVKAGTGISVDRDVKSRKRESERASRSGQSPPPHAATANSTVDPSRTPASPPSRTPASPTPTLSTLPVPSDDPLLSLKSKLGITQQSHLPQHDAPFPAVSFPPAPPPFPFSYLPYPMHFAVPAGPHFPPALPHGSFEPQVGSTEQENDGNRLMAILRGDRTEVGRAERDSTTAEEVKGADEVESMAKDLLALLRGGHLETEKQPAEGEAGDGFRVETKPVSPKVLHSTEKRTLVPFDFQEQEGAAHDAVKPPPPTTAGTQPPKLLPAQPKFSDPRQAADTVLSAMLGTLRSQPSVPPVAPQLPGLSKDAKSVLASSGEVQASMRRDLLGILVGTKVKGKDLLGEAKAEGLAEDSAQAADALPVDATADEPLIMFGGEIVDMADPEEDESAPESSVRSPEHLPQVSTAPLFEALTAEAPLLDSDHLPPATPEGAVDDAITRNLRALSVSRSPVGERSVSEIPTAGSDVLDMFAHGGDEEAVDYSDFVGSSEVLPQKVEPPQMPSAKPDLLRILLGGPSGAVPPPPRKDTPDLAHLSAATVLPPRRPGSAPTPAGVAGANLMDILMGAKSGARARPSSAQADGLRALNSNAPAGNPTPSAPARTPTPSDPLRTPPPDSMECKVAESQPPRSPTPPVSGERTISQTDLAAQEDFGKSPEPKSDLSQTLLARSAPIAASGTRPVLPKQSNPGPSLSDMLRGAQGGGAGLGGLSAPLGTRTGQPGEASAPAFVERAGPVATRGSGLLDLMLSKVAASNPVSFAVGGGPGSATSDPIAALLRMADGGLSISGETQRTTRPVEGNEGLGGLGVAPGAAPAGTGADLLALLVGKGGVKTGPTGPAIGTGGFGAPLVGGPGRGKGAGLLELLMGGKK